ncbi:nucleotidyl transferase AbiEii/AbiGii toxin family protein [Streptomyces sp. NPDC054962]
MTLPDLPEHHRRLLSDALTAGHRYGLALMGGYAVQAHGIVHRPSQDLDFATEHPASMREIIDQLDQALSGRGWDVTVIDIAPLKPFFWWKFSAQSRATGSDQRIAWPVPSWGAGSSLAPP